MQDIQREIFESFGGGLSISLATPSTHSVTRPILEPKRRKAPAVIHISQLNVGRSAKVTTAQSRMYFYVYIQPARLRKEV